jgi:hypothetical protein
VNAAERAALLTDTDRAAIRRWAESAPLPSPSQLAQLAALLPPARRQPVERRPAA